MEDTLHTAIEALERAIQSREVELNNMRKSLDQLRGSAPDFTKPPKTTEWQGMGLTKAAVLFLTEVGPRSTPEIAEALLDRGMQTRSKNFKNTVFSTLTNAEKTFVRKDGLWHLKKQK